MSGSGPPQLFVYFQPPQKTNEQGEVVPNGTECEFFVTDGDNIRLTHKGVYFLRTLPPGQPIKESVNHDQEVLFGEVSPESVSTLNTLMNSIYKPLVDKLSPQDWGVCQADQKHDFGVVFEKFSRELQEASRSLTNKINLERYDSKWENDVKNIHTTTNTKINQEMISDFMRVFNGW